jgi:hypothetical protein
MSITQVHLVLGTITCHWNVQFCYTTQCLKLGECAIGMLTAGMSTRTVAKELNVHFSTIGHLKHCFLKIWQYVQFASQPQTMCNHASPGPPHLAFSPVGSSETSHPDSWWNCGFARPKNFCTNCQKPSQGSSSVCLSSSLGSRPDFSSAS